jgi:hypothetical protein
MAFSLTVTKINTLDYGAGVTRAFRGDEIKNLRPSTEGNLSSAAIFDRMNGDSWETIYVSQIYSDVLSTMTTDEAESGSEVLTNKATDFSTLNDTLYPTTDAVEDSFQPIWYAASTGTNTYAITLTGVVPTAYYAGMRIRTIFPNANTTAATINVNALGAKAITKHVSTALVASDIVVNKVYDLVYDGTRFQIASPTGTGAMYAETGGIADVYTAVINLPEAAYTTGLPFTVKFGITNATTTPTLNVNGLGAKTIVKGDDGATALSALDLVITKIYTLIYDGTNLQINL